MGGFSAWGGIARVGGMAKDLAETGRTIKDCRREPVRALTALSRRQDQPARSATGRARPPSVARGTWSRRSRGKPRRTIDRRRAREPAPSARAGTCRYMWSPLRSQSTAPQSPLFCPSRAAQSGYERHASGCWCFQPGEPPKPLEAPTWGLFCACRSSDLPEDLVEFRLGKHLERRSSHVSLRSER